jgi:uncharacterized protein DUF3303
MAVGPEQSGVLKRRIAVHSHVRDWSGEPFLVGPALSRDRRTASKGRHDAGTLAQGGGTGGWVVCESSNAEAIANWVYGWNDLLQFEIAPVLDDKQAGRVLSKAVG